LDWRLPVALLLVGLLVAANVLGRLPLEVSLAYLCMGSVSLLLYRLDKGFAEAGTWRISEVTLLAIDLGLGIIGGLLGQALFRHKTRKPGYIGTTLLIAFVHVLWIGGIGFGLIHLGGLQDLVSALPGVFV